MHMQRIQSQKIPREAKASDLPNTDMSEIGVVPECLSRVDIGHMHLHRGDADGRNRIHQRDGRVGVPSGVQNNPIMHTPRAMYGINQSPFGV